MIERRRFLTRSKPVTAVRSLSLPLGRNEGALSRLEARRIVADLAHELDSSTLFALHWLATGIEPCLPRLLDREMLSAIEDSLDKGRLVFLEGWDLTGFGRRPMAGDAPTNTTATLVRDVMADRSVISFEGRQYRLVSSPSAVRNSLSQGYKRVGPLDALTVMKGLAENARAAPAERDAWSKLLALVQGGNAGDVALLRFAPSGGTSVPSSSEPPSTPSQLRPLVAEEHWIEIALVFEDGTPFDASCLLTLPDGRSTEGPPGAGGIVRIDGLLSAGTCTLSLPDQDETAFAFDAGATP
jgi:hypothetical protein